MTESKITETRTKVSVEEVTETRFRCHVCEMVYDPDEIITVGVDRQEDETLLTDGTAPRATRRICHHCAEGLFDYEAEAEDGSAFEESRNQVNQDWLTTTAAFTIVAMFVTTPVALIAAGIAGAGGNPAAVTLPVGAALAGLLIGWHL